MPHIIIDGYNLIRRVPRFLRAENEGLEAGRTELLFAIEDYAAALGYRVTVVFDGANRPLHLGPNVPRTDRFAGIDIIYSDRGESADSAIIRLLHELREARLAGEAGCDDDAEIVVSDDLGIRDDAIENGAFAKSTSELISAMQSKKRLSF